MKTSFSPRFVLPLAGLILGAALLPALSQTAEAAEKEFLPQLEQGAAAQARQDQETGNQGNDLFHKLPPGRNDQDNNHIALFSFICLKKHHHVSSYQKLSRDSI